MKKLAVLFFAALPLVALGQASKPPTTLRGVLLEQLHSTYDQEDWFVPAKIAIADLTVDQAKWTPAGGGHSVGQLAYHLWFWNSRALDRFNGVKVANFTGNNDETFNDFSAEQWADLVNKLNKVMSDWDTAVETASDEKLAANASLVAHVSAHNAYHIGQILYVRKLEGAWDPSKGVK
jgi:uncharacterized damage-inducible protein DinB